MKLPPTGPTKLLGKSSKAIKEIAKVGSIGVAGGVVGGVAGGGAGAAGGMVALGPAGAAVGFLVGLVGGTLGGAYAALAAERKLGRPFKD